MEIDTSGEKETEQNPEDETIQEMKATEGQKEEKSKGETRADTEENFLETCYWTNESAGITIDEYDSHYSIDN